MPLLKFAYSYVSCETARMCRLMDAFAARKSCNMYKKNLNNQLECIIVLNHSVL